MRKRNLAKTELRDQAEAKLIREKQAAPQLTQLTETDTQRFIHELEVHQIELEMQNEELVQIRAELEAALRQYTNLYDFAPVGYLTMARNSAIRQANLVGANLLGVTHSELARNRLVALVSAESLPIFNVFFEQLLVGEGKRTCEIAFERNGKGLLWTRLEATCFADGEVCLATLTDITERKQLDSLLQARVRISEFSDSHTLQESLQKTLDEAESLTDSQTGISYFLNSDQKTLTFRILSSNTLKDMSSVENDQLDYVSAQTDVWKDCVSQGVPQVCNDCSKREHINGPSRSFVPVLRELVVPVLRNDLIVMLMSVGNKSVDYENHDIEVLSQLANTVWDIVQRKWAEQALKEVNLELQTALAGERLLARTDSLTGINNRRYLYKLAEHEFEVAARYGQPLSIIMFDIDHFKKVNDSFGHMAGDQILELVTQVARAELRSADIIGRYGGEEFIIILPMTKAQNAYWLAERIRANVAGLRVPTSSVTISLGVIEMYHVSPAEAVDDAFRRVDKAMYVAKQTGRNRTMIGEP